MRPWIVKWLPVGAAEGINRRRNIPTPKVESTCPMIDEKDENTPRNVMQQQMYLRKTLGMTSLELQPSPAFSRVREERIPKEGGPLQMAGQRHFPVTGMPPSSGGRVTLFWHGWQ